MLSTILITDAVLFSVIALWLVWINITGNNDEKGGAGFVAFVLGQLILIISAIAAALTIVIDIVWG